MNRSERAQKEWTVRMESTVGPVFWAGGKLSSRFPSRLLVAHFIASGRMVKPAAVPAILFVAAT